MPDTNIHSLPQELLDIIFSRLACSSYSQIMLQYSLISRSWSHALLSLLYRSVNLSTEDRITRFIDRRAYQYCVESLALFVGRGAATHIPTFDINLVDQLFRQLGHSLSTLVLGDGAKFPLDSLEVFVTLVFVAPTW